MKDLFYDLAIIAAVPFLLLYVGIVALSGLFVVASWHSRDPR